MTEILEYISLNYTWFLIGAIIILLAIIGSYADKTNFGQGKDKTNLDDTLNKDTEENLDLLDNEIDSSLDLDVKKEIKDNDVVEDQGIQNTLVNSNLNNNIDQIGKIINNEPEIKNEQVDDFEENFNKFDEEFNALIPKKDIIDEELLEDIDSLSLDKTQKFNISDIPDLDDVELPKIKDLKTEEKNIWKF